MPEGEYRCRGSGPGVVRGAGIGPVAGSTIRVVALTALLLTAGAGGAEAHRLKAFASVEGTTVNGSVYFAGMGAARGVDVKMLGPDGSLVAETTTDDQGKFAMTVPQRMDYRIVSDTGDGHRAEFLIRAAEFSELLPSQDPAPVQTAAGAAAEGAPIANPSAAALEAVIDRAIARQIGLLREQLDASESQLRLRDILGGLGWIAGITGVVCWVASRHRRSQ